MAKKDIRKDRTVGFNMTPMIDIIFNLIIFFMLVSQFTQLAVEDVVLPLAKKAEPKEMGEVNTIVINIVDPDEPRILIFHQEYNYSDLTDYLKKKKEAVGEGGQLTVILRADAMVPYYDIARVMVATGEAGIESWSVNTLLEED